jgi:Zn finger protein HypA/HybF involved in hydrogenase expression
MTKRLLNICKNCNHTWYPRGHKISQKCPHCGSVDVRIDWVRELTPIVFSGIALVGILFYLIQYF